MRIVSATVKNYRIHKDTRVEFDPARTLIGGPNESGKSTFIEAIHRGLFLKARVSGTLREGMVSLLHPGVPTVEVRFEVRGRSYRLVKSFNGLKGTTLLAEDGGPTWQGEEAELKLAHLLGVNPQEIMGKASEKKLGLQWSHLWVWQGRGGEDPSSDLSAQHESLVRRLQEIGGAVVMQSEEDARVAQHFAKAVAEFYSLKNWKVLKGSKLAEAEERVLRAQKVYDEACERVNELKRAMDDYFEALEMERGSRRDLERLSKELDAVEAGLKELAELEREEESKRFLYQRAKERLDNLEGVKSKIEKIHAQIELLEGSLGPRREERKRLEEELEGIRENLKGIKDKYREVSERVRDCRLKRDLVSALLRFFKGQQEKRELRARWRRVCELKSEMEALKGKLARLQKVDKRALSYLQKLQGELLEARAALGAVATEVRVKSSRLPVLVNGEPVGEGEGVTVTEVTEVAIGDEVSLQIRPGGGERLVELRKSLEKVEKRLNKRLDDLGVSSVEEAEEVFERRRDLESRVKRLEATLRELNWGGLESRLEELRAELTKVFADIKRRLGEIGPFEGPKSLKSAKVLLGDLELKLEEAEAEEKKIAAMVSKTEREEQKVQGRLESLKVEMDRDEKTLSKYKNNLEVFESEYGDEARRAEALVKARAQVSEAEAELERVKKAIEALHPQRLRADHERLTKACKEKRRLIQEAKETMAASGAILALDGRVDPNAQKEEAEAELERARAELERVRVRAEALKMVHLLFQQKQQELAEILSAPLAERITRYLKCVFPDAEAVVEFKENSFTGIKLVRREGDLPGELAFDELSGGTKEQVAAAVRLAMAELLAEDHGGCLPVVFDDAFVNTDPQRVKEIQRMLYLASNSNLQVIVLTSNPSDYAGFGAREVRFG